MKKKSFIILTPGVNDKLSSSKPEWRPNNQEHLYLQSLSSLDLHLLVTPGAYPRRKHVKGAPLGLAPALLANFLTRLERVAKDKYSSLLGLVASNERKKFYTLTPGEASPTISV